VMEVQSEGLRLFRCNDIITFSTVTRLECRIKKSHHLRDGF
jgi:hypothetical protein